MDKKIISIDVGIKNLAYCIIKKTDKNFQIIDWDTVNLIEDEIDNQPICNNFIKNKPCTKKACVYIEKNDSKLYYCDKKGCQKFLCQTYSDCKHNKIKKITTKSFSLLQLGSILFKKLNEIKDKILDVDEVVIENQPVLKNPTMKSVQILLFSFFIDHGFNSNDSPINNVYLFSARDKLKLYDGPKIDCELTDKYKKRKFLSIEYAKYYIKNTTFYDFFLNHKKKDDLSDSFMQGYYYLFK